MALLRPGEPAPGFATRDQKGNEVRLADLRGKRVALYFYPMDDTPGCTVEACAFRDAHEALRDAGVEVLGVSTQGEASHRAFADKFGLAFPLLADPDKRITRAYGALGLTGLARRVTYLIGPGGSIEHVWSSVTPRGHDREVLDAASALAAGRAPGPPQP